MEKIDIVNKLIGPTSPTGESNADGQRLINLMEFSALFETMLQQMCDLNQSTLSPAASERRIGELARNTLAEAVETIKDALAQTEPKK